MNVSKKKWTWIAGAALVVLAAFLLGRCTGPETVEDTPSENEEPAAEAKAEEVWTCSMHPQVRQPEPGLCPICAMELIPVANDEDPDDDGELPRLSVSERAAALMRVETEPVERLQAKHELRFLGMLEADETLLRDVVVRSESYLEKLEANYLWKRVGKGEPLAELYSPAVVAAANELLAAARAGRDSRNLEIVRGKLRRFGIGDDQIDGILEKGEAPHTYELRSPIDGHVMTLSGREGDWLPEGQRLMQIMNPFHLWLQLEAYERDLAWLRTGLKATFSVETFPGEEFEGEVTFISPHVDRKKRTAQIRVEVPNPDHRLLPGMFARGIIRVTLDEEPSLVIPATAPLITGKRAVVYVQLSDRERPTFEGRQVTLGPRAGDFYVVRDGLEEGELVVTRGNFKIDSELQIRGRPSMMAPEFLEEPDDPEAIDYREPPERPGFAEEVPASFGKELRPVVEGYLGMVTAMADDDHDAARRALGVLHEALLEIGQHRLEGQAHTAWMEHYENLHLLTHHIEAAEDLDGMRGYLQETTREVEEMAVSFGAGQLPTIYRLYCPMVDGDEGGTWLQDHEQVANPYYGAMMLRCGEVLGLLNEEGGERRGGG